MTVTEEAALQVMSLEGAPPGFFCLQILNGGRSPPPAAGRSRGASTLRCPAQTLCTLSGLSDAGNRPSSSG